MTDDDQTAMLREITDKLARQCIEKRLEPPFSIDLTDQTGYTVSAAYVADQERGGIKLFGVKMPEDEHGQVPVHTFVFPLKVHAKDHRGKVYNTTVHTRH